MIRRLLQFVVGSYPPVPYLVTTALWAAGLTGLAAAGARTAWRPDRGLAVTVLTLFIDMLVIRALDDIRDLEYDRTAHPDRPLAAGRVEVRDLIVLVAAGSLLTLAGNAGRGWGALLLAAHLVYVVALVVVNVRLRWPASENLLVHLPLNLPVQLLLCGYVYAAYLHDRGWPATGRGLLAVLAVVLVQVHVEFARRVTRRPARTERTYVHQLGLAGTIAVASGAAVLSAGCAVLAGAGPWRWLAPATLVIPLAAGWRFRRSRLARWPVRAVVAFALGGFAAYLSVGLLAGTAA